MEPGTYFLYYARDVKNNLTPVPLFTKRVDVLPQAVVKYWSREILIQYFPIALKLDRHLESTAAKMPVKYRSDAIILTSLINPLKH